MNEIFSMLSSKYSIYVVAALFITLMILLRWLRPRDEEYPFERQPVFTNAELKFLMTLQEVTPEGAILLSKVRLADFLKVTAEQRFYIGHFNKVARKHVDFLLVDIDGNPLLAIELDDSSHRTSRRTMENDAFKNNAFAAAKLPLLRVPVRRSYDASEIENLILRGIAEGH